MSRKIKASAPGKLLLLGDHAVVYNRPCLVTAVNSRITIHAELGKDKQMVIKAPQLRENDYIRKLGELEDNNEQVPKEVAFVRKTVELFISKYPVKQGITIKTKSDFSHRYGFGSSSAVTVATMLALCKLYKQDCSKKEIFDLAYKVNLAIQGVGSGFDLAAATWGKTLYFVTGGKEVKVLPDNIMPLVIGYSGTKGDTPTIVKRVKKLKKEKPEKVEEIFNQITRLVEKGRTHFINQEWKQLGSLMQKDQQLLKKLGVSTPKLDKMCGSALTAGAYGAKLSGAGGGDCMIALAPADKKETVRQAIESAGGKIIKVSPNAQGVKRET